MAMSVRTMRRLDFWVGVPACFVLSMVNDVFRGLSFGKKRNDDPVRKIIFIKLSEMGAISLSYPLFVEIEKTYPEAELFFLTFEKNKNFFKILGGIVPEKNIYTVREASLAFLLNDVLRALWKIRKQEIDIAFDLEMLTRFSAILTFLTGAEKKVGFSVYTFEGLYRGDFLTHKVQYNPLQHISHSYLSLGKAVASIEKKTPEFQEAIKDEEIILPKYISHENDRKSLEKKLSDLKINITDPIFLTNPGEWDWPFNLREWPLENYIELTKKILAQDGKNQVIMVGSPGISGKSKKLFEAVSDPRCADLSGKTTISELLELFLVSRALIVNDSGLAHFAALTPIRKFVFFGPESPQIFGPLGENTHVFFSKFPCSPCFSVFNHRNSACHDNVCLKSIDPGYVYDYVMKHIV